MKQTGEQGPDRGHSDQSDHKQRRGFQLNREMTCTLLWRRNQIGKKKTFTEIKQF